MRFRTFIYPFVPLEHLIVYIIAHSALKPLTVPGLLYA
jgi:hypothetical protein